MLSSSSTAAARRIITSTRRSSASVIRSKYNNTSSRSLVSLTTQQQPSSQYYGIDRTAQPLIWCPNTQFIPTKQQHKRYMSSDDLPYHIVMGMPALSPTMDAGTISKWNVKEGDSFVAGDSLAVIETDKASMDFEAQDDGVVAKLLVSEGGGEIAVGVPVMVTVEEEEDVSAFANFEAGAAPDTSSTEAEVTPQPEQPAVAAAAPTPTPVAPTPTPVAPTASIPSPTSVAQPSAAPLDAISLGGSTWGRLAAEKSPLAKLLASKQKEYIKKYGSTGHVPIV